MTLTVNWDRRKKNLSLSVASNTTQQPVQEGTLETYTPITLDAIVLDTITEANCDGTSGTAIITKNTGTFGDVRPGDLVTGDVNLPGSAFVISKDSDTQITLNGNLTGAITNASLTFNDSGSKTLNLTVMALGMTIVPGKDYWTFTPVFYQFDGKNAVDVGNTGTDDNATMATGKVNATSTVGLNTGTNPSIQRSIDELLLNARNDRSDS